MKVYSPRLSPCYVISVIILVFIGFFIYQQSRPGGYSQWTSWSRCSKSCGEGIQVRNRKCTAPHPGMLGKDCQGPSVMKHSCNIVRYCPVDGGLTEWSKFGECDKKCGGGVKKKTRSCTNPKPLYGGKDCEGETVKTMSCKTQPCPINGGFSNWSEFGKCELTGETICGKGKHVRTRSCNKPVPQYGGKGCEGKDSETAECEIPCPTTAPRTNTSSTKNTTLAPVTVKVP